PPSAPALFDPMTEWLNIQRIPSGDAGTLVPPPSPKLGKRIRHVTSGTPPLRPRTPRRDVGGDPVDQNADQRRKARHGASWGEYVGTCHFTPLAPNLRCSVFLNRVLSIGFWAHNFLPESGASSP